MTGAAATSGARFGLPLALGGVGVVVLVALLDGAALLEGARSWPAHAALAFAIYGLSHVTRIVRSLVVLGGTARSVQSVAVAHLASASWSGLLPLKIGELVRMIALGRASTGPWQGLRVVWVERAFDAVLIAGAALGVLVSMPGAAGRVLPVLTLSIGLLAVTITAVVALPENLVMAKHWIVRRYTSAWSLRALAVLDELVEGVRGLRSLVVGKVATLGLLTVAVWGLEGLGLWVLSRSGGSSPVVAMLGVLSDAVWLDGTDAAGWHTIVFACLAAMALLAVAAELFGGSVAPVRRR